MFIHSESLLDPRSLHKADPHPLVQAVHRGEGSIQLTWVSTEAQRITIGEIPGVQAMWGPQRLFLLLKKPI